MAVTAMAKSDELLRRLFESDSEAQHDLYKGYAGVIQKSVKCALKGFDEADVKDCVSGTMHKLFDNDFRRLKSFRGESTLETYLSRIARNEAIDYARSRRNRQLVSLQKALSSDEREFTLLDVLPHISPDPLDVLCKRELRRQIKNAISKLSLEQQEVVYDWFYNGLSMRDIADIRGEKLGTVYKRRDVAFKRLRAVLQLRLNGAHISLRDMSMLVDGDMPIGRMERIMSHIRSCKVCRKALISFISIVRTISESLE